VLVSIAILAAAKLLGSWTRSTSAFGSR